ncbi:MAG: Laminin G domain protein [Microgenomates group bacterium ADurb.Bin238]|nr:MAG: Laminin G domain protein [Microgenomates group bacterium ADurb.Bin238]
MRSSTTGNPVIDLVIGFNGVNNSNTGKPSFLVRDNNGIGLKYITGSTPINDNQWHHIVATRNSLKTMTIFIDGNEITSGSDTMTNPVTTDTVRIGDEPINSSITNFNGLIDEVKIFPYALTADQIKKEYNLGAAVVIGAGAYATPSARLNDSLVSHWSFDELSGQTAYDKVGNNHTTLGADTNPGSDDPTWKTASECKTNGCLEFDGSDDHTYKNSISPTLSSTLSICAYIKTSSTNKYILQLNRSPSNYFYEFILQINGYGKLQFWDYSNSNYGFNLNQSSNTAINDNTWKHICFVKSGTTGKYYINGQLDNQTTAASDITYGSNDFVIEKNYRDNSLYFSGLIDEVKIYSSALTPEQIRQDMNTGSTLAVSTTTSEAADLTDGEGNPPVAEWKLDEKTGSTANDTSGNGYTGTLTNNPVWKSSRECKIGACLEFSSTAQVSTTLNTDNLSPPITISAWFYPTDTSTNTQAIVSGYTGHTDRWDVIFNRSLNGKVGWLYHGISGSTYSTNTVPLNTWHQVTTIHTGSNIIVYLNGQYQGSNATSGGISTGQTIRIGNWYSGNQPFNGLIDHVKIYDYARTPAQIAYDYNRGAPIAHWKMDECQGTTIHDSSGNNNHGTLTVTTTGGNTNGVGTCNTSTSAWGTGASGKFGASLNFDGNGDYIDAGNNNVLYPPSTLSISAWIKTSLINQNAAIAGPWSTSGNTQNSYLIYLGQDASNGKLGFAIYEADNHSVMLKPTNNVSITADTWYHIVGVANGSVLRLYVNGKDSGQTASYDGTIKTIGSSNFMIGRLASNVYYFNGLIDDIRLYNYALSATQIKKVMNEGSALRFGN